MIKEHQLKLIYGISLCYSTPAERGENVCPYFFSERAMNQGYTVLLRKKKVQIEGQGILL